MSAYTIIGGGAIGGTLAFDLAGAGHDVTIIDTDPAHVEAIREHGLRVRLPEQPDQVAEMDAFTPDELPDSARFDKVLLAVKSQATASAMSFIAPRLASDGYVVSVQNGLNGHAVAEHIGVKRTISAFVNFAADVLGPGLIGAGGPGALVVGELCGNASERVDALVADLQAWGPAQSSRNVQGFLWAKMSYASMLVTTSLVDAPMADVIDTNRPVMHQIAGEVLAVATAEGVHLEAFDAFDPTGYLPDATEIQANAATDRLVAWLHTLDKKRSGIWRDIVVRQRPTEVPYQYGSILQLARQHDVLVPTLTRVLERLQDLESRQVEMGEHLLTGLVAPV